MQIGEMVAVVVQVEKKENCWFCKEEAKKDGLKSNLTRGDVRGKKEKAVPLAGLQWTTGAFGGVGTEAHHLIPCRSIKDVKGTLHPYIEEGNVISGDIGYDLNHANNSVWMPGRSKDNRLKAKSDDDLKEIIKKSTTQIHNSGHPDYRSRVKEILDMLVEKIIRDDIPDKKCPLCEADMDDKLRPPYGLVRRLDTISAKMRILLTGSPNSWLLDKGYYTFSRSLKEKVKGWIKNRDI